MTTVHPIPIRDLARPPVRGAVPGPASCARERRGWRRGIRGRDGPLVRDSSDPGRDHRGDRLRRRGAHPHPVAPPGRRRSSASPVATARRPDRWPPSTPGRNGPRRGLAACPRPTPSSWPSPTARPPPSSRTSSPTGTAVIDLGPDFRLRDAADYPRWYGFEHPRPDLLERAVYGLPELHRAELQALVHERVAIVGSPGCYPTATILALAPLARAGLIEDLVVDAKSGVSGAGREAKAHLMFGEVNESVSAYGIGGHRHVAEIEQELAGAAIAGGLEPDANPGRDGGRLPAAPHPDDPGHPVRLPRPTDPPRDPGRAGRAVRRRLRGRAVRARRRQPAVDQAHDRQQPCPASTSMPTSGPAGSSPSASRTTS